jgi:hypothetical protein
LSGTQSVCWKGRTLGLGLARPAASSEQLKERLGRGGGVGPPDAVAAVEADDAFRPLRAHATQAQTHR